MEVSAEQQDFSLLHDSEFIKHEVEQAIREQSQPEKPKNQEEIKETDVLKKSEEIPIKPEEIPGAAKSEDLPPKPEEILAKPADITNKPEVIPKKPEEETEMEVDMTFTKELRKATKDVHKLSDVLVNAKFAFALSDDDVWADGLLSFYEIYKFLEKNLSDDLLPKELRRTAAFEQDLSYFLGSDWQETYEPRDSVKKYLAHLEEVNAKSKLLLFAYAYQMYMALMSGGQLLQKKRMIARKLWIGKSDDEPELEPLNIDSVGDLEKRPMPLQVTICPAGCAATYFPEDIKILKAKLRTVLNKHYGQFDEKMKEDFIEESRNVFIYNSDVVRSIKGVNRANLRKLAMVLVFVVGVYFALKLARR